jgi:hypothetical protein
VEDVVRAEADDFLKGAMHKALKNNGGVGLRSSIV